MGTDVGELSTIIQVSNISVHATQEQMKKLFSYMGEIDEIRMYPSKCIQQPQYRICFIKFAEQWSVNVAQHLTNTVFIDRALIVVPFNAKSIPSEEKTYLDLLCPSSAFPGLISSSFNDVINDVDAVDGNLMITSKDPNLEKLGLPQYPPLPANLDPDVIESIRRTVNVSNIGAAITGQRLLNFMNEMVGEVKYLQITGNDNETTKSALVEFTERASVAKALQRDGLMFVNNPLCIKHSAIAITEHNKNKMPIKTGFEEAMKKVKAAENLITAVVEPELEPRSKSRRRHRSSSRSSRRSRSRSRHRRSRSRGRRSRSRARRSRSRKRRSHSRSRRSRSRNRRSRSRNRRSRSRRRSSPSRRRRSHSRKRRSLSRRKRSRSRTRRSSSRKRRSHSRKRRTSKDRSRDRRSCSNRSIEKGSRSSRSQSTKRDKRDKKDRSSSVELPTEKSDLKKSCSRSRDRSLSPDRRSRSKRRSRSHHSRRSHSKSRSKSHRKRSTSKSRSKSHRNRRSSERKSRSHSKTSKRSPSKSSKKSSKRSKSPERKSSLGENDSLNKSLSDKEEKSFEDQIYRKESPISNAADVSMSISSPSDDVTDEPMKETI